MFTDKASKSEKSSSAAATAKKQQPKKKVLEPSVLEPAVEEVKEVVATEKKKRAPRKKAAAKDSDMEDLIADLDATKIADTESDKKRPATPVLKEIFKIEFPGKEYNIIMKFLREMDKSGEVEGLGEHIAAIQSGMALVAKSEHAGNNGDHEKACKLFSEAYLEYFWDAFDAITSARIIPRDLANDWETMKNEMEEIYNRT